jgi:hypothetical protein
MHPFWSSHEEKCVCVRLSMGGGHGRSWSFHGSPWGARQRGKGGEEEVGGAAWGRHGVREGCRRGLLGAAGCSGLLCCVLRLRKNRRKERRKKGRKRKEKKEKISNLKIFREKNKRQLMKLVKNYFCTKKVICLIIIK